MITKTQINQIIKAVAILRKEAKYNSNHIGDGGMSKETVRDLETLVPPLFVPDKTMLTYTSPKSSTETSQKSPIEILPSKKENLTNNILKRYVNILDKKFNKSSIAQAFLKGFFNKCAEEESSLTEFANAMVGTPGKLGGLIGSGVGSMGALGIRALVDKDPISLPEHAMYGLGGGSAGGYLGFLIGDALGGEENKYPKAVKNIPIAKNILNFPEKKKPVHTLTELRKAKDLSDNNNYMEKAIIIHGLLKNKPREFELSDPDKHGYVGVTHKKTGFKIHHPSYMLPASFIKTLDKKDLTDFVPKL